VDGLVMQVVLVLRVTAVHRIFQGFGVLVEMRPIG
jgi:hypothetical protein